MQYKLHETTVIEVHYQAAPSDGGTHWRIENQDGVGLQYYLGRALTTPEAVRYTPAPAAERDGHGHGVGADLGSDITVNPSSLASSQMTNTR
jgi:hypothetical protein